MDSLQANLYVVDGPLQLINAIEARCALTTPGSYNILVVRYLLGSHNRNQIEKCIGLVEWDEIVRINPFLTNFSTTISFGYLIKRLSRYEIDNLFIGGFFYLPNHYFKANLNFKKAFLVDDGNVTLNIKDKLDDQIQLRDLDSGFISNIRKFIYRSLHLKEPRKIDYDLFTFFNLEQNENYKIIRNEFNFLKSLSEEKKIKRNEVYFLGGPLVELRVIELDYHLQNLRTMTDYYERKGQRLYYIKHRREASSTLKKISDLRIPILSFNYPIELELIFAKKLPLGILSYYSSALLSLYNMHDKLEIAAVRLNNKQLSQKFYDEINSIYDHYAKHFPVVRIEELQC